MNQLLKNIVLASVFMAPLVSHAMGGEQWIKDTQSVCEIYGAYPDSGESVEWSCGCTNGKASGNGKLEWSLHGSKHIHYEGDLLAGKMQGKGTLSWANGESYEGEWKDYQRTGTGTMTWANGNLTKVAGKTTNFKEKDS